MQIQLKQPEIIAALKMYVAHQGINLQGKTVEIGFTAGRGDTGLSASISIEEASLPVLDFDGENSKPVLSVVPSIPVSAASPISGEEAAPAEPVPEAQATGTNDAAPAKATTSLFG